MSKETDKLQKNLKEAIFEQERKKVRYDAHVIVAEGHRRQLSEIVEQNQILMHELMNSGNKVEEINSQLQKALEAESIKNNEISNEL